MGKIKVYCGCFKRNLGIKTNSVLLLLKNVKKNRCILFKRVHRFFNLVSQKGRGNIEAMVEGWAEHNA